MDAMSQPAVYGFSPDAVLLLLLQWYQIKYYYYRPNQKM